MHSQRRGDPDRAFQANCKHFATPLETPSLWAGNKFVSNRKPPQSPNEAAKMKNLA
jgi:hypothetical protein